MKTISLLVLIHFCNVFALNAQDTLQKQDTIKKTPYLIWIYTDNSPYRLSGILYKTNDSSLVIIKSYPPNNSNYKSPKTTIKATSINTIKIRQKNNRLIGVLIGGITGGSIGGFYGYSLGDDPPTYCSALTCFKPRFKAKEKAVIGFISMAGLGVLVGILGTIKVKIPINKSMNNFNKNKYKLKEYSIL